MSEENNDLFDGIQILSPTELNAVVKDEATGGEPGADSLEDGFTIAPVTASTGAAAPTETGGTPPAVKPNSNEGSDELKYKALMKELVKADILTVEQLEELEDMPGTFDSIKSLMEKTLDTKFKSKEENWKKSLSSDKKRFLEIEDAFDDTTVAIQMAQRLTYLEGLNTETVKADEQLQKQLYYNQLIGKGFSNDDAVEQIEDAIAVNKLEEKALKALPELKQVTAATVESSRLAKEERTQKQIAADESKFQFLLESIEKKDSFIDGLQLNKVAKDKIKSNILTVVHKDDAGREYNSLMYKQKNNPAEFEMLINYYDSLGMFNIDKEGKFKPDISKLKTIAKTQAVNELDKILTAEEQRGLGRNTSVETSERTESIISMLERATRK